LATLKRQQKHVGCREEASEENENGREAEANYLKGLKCNTMGFYNKCRRCT